MYDFLHTDGVCPISAAVSLINRLTAFLLTVGVDSKYDKNTLLTLARRKSFGVYINPIDLATKTNRLG